MINMKTMDYHTLYRMEKIKMCHLDICKCFQQYLEAEIYIFQKYSLLWITKKIVFFHSKLFLQNLKNLFIHFKLRNKNPL